LKAKKREEKNYCPSPTYCHQVKLAEYNRIQLICVQGHAGMDGNEMAVQLAREGFSHSLIGPVPALGVSARGFQGSEQGLDEHETQAVPAVRLWTKAG
jgi:ribonuclease HI